MKNVFDKIIKLALHFTILICFNVVGQNTNIGFSEQKAAPVLPDKFYYTFSKLAEGNYSSPVWSPDGNKIAFTTKELTGIMIMDKEGKNIKMLNKELGTGYKFTWSLDNNHIAYRGSRFEENKRIQFVGVIDLKDYSDTILVFQKRLQPPVWQYEKNGKRLSYVINNKVIFSDLYLYASAKDGYISEIPNVNTFFYYTSGILYRVNENTSVIIEENQIQGMDPVISPDRKHFVYSHKGKLHLRSFDSETLITLGYGVNPSWSPDASYIVYQKTTDDGHVYTASDLYIMDINSLQSYALTNTSDIFEVNPSWSPEGKNIVFNDEKDGSIYLITFN